MSIKQSILSLAQVQDITKTYPSPWLVYDEAGIRSNMLKFNQAFSLFPHFQNYFAVKACPNPSILSILKDMGSGADCSSMGELVMSERCGIHGEDIMFTSNNTKAEEFIKADSLGAIINFDDITHIGFYQDHVGHMPRIACCRFNPGPLKDGNAIIGKPQEAKYGITKAQIIQAYQQLKDAGVQRFGLHTMVISNELQLEYFVETVNILFELVEEIEAKLGISMEFVNLGGGIGIPYQTTQVALDLDQLAQSIWNSYQAHFGTHRSAPLRIVMECGRMITGPYGQLIARVEHVTAKYKKFVGLDASMQCLMRPAIYGAYHHITVMGKEEMPIYDSYDVTGSLCENNDKFAIDRPLPEVQVGDYMVIHDAGAHGTAMGFNYNAKLRPAELLLQSDGTIKLIRRAETLEDYFATVDGVDGFVYTG